MVTKAIFIKQYKKTIFNSNIELFTTNIKNYIIT